MVYPSGTDSPGYSRTKGRKTVVVVVVVVVSVTVVFSAVAYYCTNTQEAVFRFVSAVTLPLPFCRSAVLKFRCYKEKSARKFRSGSSIGNTAIRNGN